MGVWRPGLVAVVAAAAVTLAGCAGSQSDRAGGGADQPYRVMITAGLGGQGALAANAQTSVLAAKAGAQVVNESGGIGGRKVELTVVDDGGDPTTAVTKLREAISSNHKPDLYLDSGPSTVALAVLPVLKSAGILSFNISPTEDTSNPAKFPLNFDLAPGPDDNARAIAEYVKQKGYTPVGVIHSSSGSGVAYGEAAAAAMKKDGIAVSGNESYDTSALDMTPQLQALKDSGAKALVVDAYGAPLGYILQNLQRLGWNVPLIGQTTVSATNLIAADPPAGVLGTPQVANLVTQVFQSTVYDAANVNVNKMVDTMASLGKIPAPLILADNYDAFQLVAAAAKQAGTTTDAKKLASALESDQVQANAKTAFLPRYHYSAQSHAAQPTVDAYRFTAPTALVNGQFGNPSAGGAQR
ncbi:amino acid ABC transporter substrate-binding protein [Rhodococcus sp. D2-41]|uniref:ABC transporter substrate-binding protein n=1 Tax=Speluncibacter jeojiensis TaxID=2710754 RepID=UPI00241051C6|nr:ABC transporter substrate-binding protein [Rhodococcus sp. D2-41]MDG3010126.1 amino acid ABC transporter substrate-binding protein [Rhodococcus sp. D2-41]